MANRYCAGIAGLLVMGTLALVGCGGDGDGGCRTKGAALRTTATTSSGGFASLPPVSGVPQTITVPNSLENLEGGANNCMPFFTSPVRYQQVYRASEFSTLSGPGLITHLRFRPEGPSGPWYPFTATIHNITLTLATSDWQPDSDVWVFANNLHDDATVVHDGPLSLSSTANDPYTYPIPRPFDIVIELETPFLYDPAEGNLVLEVRNYDGWDVVTTPPSDRTRVFFDAHRAAPDPISRLWHYGNADASMAQRRSTTGLVTQFVFGPVRVEVGIDIKPGSYPNAINPASNGVVSVAILSTQDFDATTVDPATVELAGAGVAVRGKSSKYLAHTEDVNGDGLLDLVVQVETENLDPGLFQDSFAELTGNLYAAYGATPIYGLDEITVVPPE